MATTGNGQSKTKKALLEAGSEAAGGAVQGKVVCPARAQFGEAQSAAGKGKCEAIVLPSLSVNPKNAKKKKAERMTSHLVSSSAALEAGLVRHSNEGICPTKE